MCLILSISCWHVTRLSRHSVRLMNEQQSLHHSQSKVFCRDVFGLWLLTDSDVQTFLEGKENQNTQRKTDSYVFSGFVYGISRGWERKSTTGRFVTGRFWPCTWKISSVGEDQEFCILKITPIVCFCSVSTHFFILSLSANALYDFYSGIVDPLFSFVNKVDFSCQ